MDGEHNNMDGLGQCFANFAGTYCYRKGIEFGVSLLLLGVVLYVVGALLLRHGLRQPGMLSSLSLMGVSLVANLLFCFYNTHFWLFAAETYFYNLYYLSIVASVARAYLLKVRPNPLPARPDSPSRRLIPAEPPTAEFPSRGVFFSVVGLVGLVYTCIFATSVHFQVLSSVSQGVRYCEEIWYLCFDAVCVLLSVGVLVLMVKNQREEARKLEGFRSLYTGRQQGTATQEDIERYSQNSEDGGRAREGSGGQIHNPLERVNWWVGANVGSQLVNLVESGLFLSATPPSCLIISSQPNSSNLLQLGFVFLTLYVGYVATLWYALAVKIEQERSHIDRTVQFVSEARSVGNIELFLPSSLDAHSL